MVRLFWICLGGAFGTGLRYGVSLWAPRLLGISFPYATLIVNVVGSFLIGLIMYLGLNTALLSPTVRFTLTTGVMGGLTTYSTFNYETLRSFQEGQWLLGTLNLLLTVCGCIVAGLLGLACGRFVAGCVNG